jgi:hypothetical protein
MLQFDGLSVEGRSLYAWLVLVERTSLFCRRDVFVEPHSLRSHRDPAPTDRDAILFAPQMIKCLMTVRSSIEPNAHSGCHLLTETNRWSTSGR